MGNQAAAMLGMEGVPISVEESLAGMMKVVSLLITLSFDPFMHCHRSINTRELTKKKLDRHSHSRLHVR